jgi:hypothetical protein
MTDVDREQLKRDSVDALEAFSPDSLRALGPPYRLHGELMHGALRDGNENAITWHLINALEKLERGS